MSILTDSLRIFKWSFTELKRIQRSTHSTATRYNNYNLKSTILPSSEGGLTDIKELS